VSAVEVLAQQPPISRHCPIDFLSYSDPSFSNSS